MTQLCDVYNAVQGCLCVFHGHNMIDGRDEHTTVFCVFVFCAICY